MKKNILKLALIALLAVPALQSCEMDQFPSSSVSSEESWQTLNDLYAHDLGTMASIRSMSRLGWDVSDIQCDYFQPNKAYGNRGGEIYRWNFQAAESDMVDAWSNPFGNLVTFNDFLGNYEKACPNGIDALNSDDQETVSQYLCNAYFGRALAYYQLVVRFAKDYEPSTAAEDLGLPIITEVNINTRTGRASIEDTYAFISENLDKALEYCTSDEPSTDYISEPVIKFLQAKVAFDKHEYDDAISLAKEVIENYSFALPVSQDEFDAIWTEDEGAEIVWKPYCDTQENFSFGNFLTYGSGKYAPDWIPAKSTIDMYDAADYRLAKWFRDPEAPVSNGDATVDDVLLFGKHQGNPNLMLSSDDAAHTYKQTPKVFRLAELYLIIAEAAYLNGDETTAKNYLGDLQETRGVARSATSGSLLFTNIKDEWKKEFIGEGKRLICLKRWHEGFSRNPAAQNNSLIVTADADQNIARTVSANDQRFVWDIPDNDKIHGGLEGNWSL